MSPWPALISASRCRASASSSASARLATCPSFVLVVRVGDQFGLVVLDLLHRLHRRDRLEQQGQPPVDPRGQHQRRQERRVHLAAGPFGQPQHGVERGVGAQVVPVFLHRHRPRGGQVPAGGGPVVQDRADRRVVGAAQLVGEIGWGEPPLDGQRGRGQRGLHDPPLPGEDLHRAEVPAAGLA